jgi:uncharacterized protein (DUF433 family)
MRPGIHRTTVSTACMIAVHVLGRPASIRAGISAAAVTKRRDANESLADLAAGYDLTQSEIEQAVLFERAA